MAGKKTKTNKKINSEHKQTYPLTKTSSEKSEREYNSDKDVNYDRGSYVY